MRQAAGRDPPTVVVSLLDVGRQRDRDRDSVSLGGVDAGITAVDVVRIQRIHHAVVSTRRAPMSAAAAGNEIAEFAAFRTAAGQAVVAHSSKLLTVELGSRVKHGLLKFPPPAEVRFFFTFGF